MRLTKEEKRERERKKKEAWRDEINRLQVRQAQRTDQDARQLRHIREHRQFEKEVAEKLLSPGFKQWYESTTGESVAVFLEAAEDVLERASRGESNIRWTDWVQMRVEIIAHRFPWSNPEMKAFWSAEIAAAQSPRERRFILQRVATPTWANREAMLAIYRERDARVAATGIPHDVDHIVPLVSRVVCGLHCEFNLRVITATENRKKSNRFTAG